MPPHMHMAPFAAGSVRPLSQDTRAPPSSQHVYMPAILTGCVAAHALKRRRHLARISRAATATKGYPGWSLFPTMDFSEPASGLSRSKPQQPSRQGLEKSFFASPSEIGRGKITLPTIPSEGSLIALVDSLRSGTLEDWLSIEDVRRGIDALNRDYNFGLSPADADRFCAQIAVSDEKNLSPAKGVRSEAFISHIRRLGQILRRVYRVVTMEQLRVVLLIAFNHFDLDCDGHLSLQEFCVAIVGLGLKLELNDAAYLYDFLGVSKCKEERALDWNGVTSALGGLVEGAARSAQTTINNVAQDVQCLFSETSAPAKRALSLAVSQHAADAAEAAIDIFGITVTVQEVVQALHECAQANICPDIACIGPLAVVLLAMAARAAKEVDAITVKEMSEDEALLYAVCFHGQDFTQAQFQRLVGCRNFRWGEAEPGEVLADGASSGTVKCLVRGGAAVVAEGGHQMPLSIGNFIGDVAALDDVTRSEETVVATCKTVYVEWDAKDLRECLDHDDKASVRMGVLLADQMMERWRQLADFRWSSEGDAERYQRGLVQTQQAEPCGSSGNSVAVFDELFASADSLGQGFILESDLHKVMPCLARRLCFGKAGADASRLFAHLDADGDRRVTRDDFQRGLVDLERAIADGLDGVTVAELETVLQRAFNTVDQDKDGVICLDEFRTAALKLGLPLDARQAAMLHPFVVLNPTVAHLTGSGHGCDEVIAAVASGKDTASARAHTPAAGAVVPEGDPGSVWSALRSAMGSHAERRGLARVGYMAGRVSDIVSGPERIEEKLQAVWEACVHDGDALAESLLSVVTVVGCSAAIFGITQHVGGIDGSQDIKLDDLLPFVTFMAATGIHTSREMMDAQISDLSERDALLYVKAFKPHDISIHEFQMLMKLGETTWESVDAGSSLSSDAAKRGMVAVVSGCLEVVPEDGIEEEESFAATRVTRPVKRKRTGDFLCSQQRSSDHVSDSMAHTEDPVHAVRAVRSSTVVSWDMEALRTYLARDEKLNMKLQRARMISMA